MLIASSDVISVPSAAIDHYFVGNDHELGDLIREMIIVNLCN